MVASAREAVCRPRAGRSIFPTRRTYLFTQFPALRTGLLSNVPPGTDFLTDCLDLILLPTLNIAVQLTVILVGSGFYSNKIIEADFFQAHAGCIEHIKADALNMKIRSVLMSATPWIFPAMDCRASAIPHHYSTPSVFLRDLCDLLFKFFFADFCEKRAVVAKRAIRA
jgi:hypothetical protein